MNHNEYLNLLTIISNAKETINTALLRINAFCRNRKMSFPNALSFMLDMRKTTLQTRLNLYFEHTQGGEPMSQQAFSKLRMNFDHSPFETMVQEAVKKEYSGQYELPHYLGYHVLAVDGSYLQLPRVKALGDTFGVRGGSNQPSAGISVLYDVLHGWPLDPIITRTDMNERVECGKHIQFICEKLPHIAEKSIITLDRGYPSLDIFEKLQVSGLKFIARCKNGFATLVDKAMVGDSIITLKNGVCVRVVKFILSTGETETLVTNLFDLPEDAFIKLYSLRWGIETAYFQLKRELCVEKFSGKTPNAIRQDFWASMVLMQAVAVFQLEADLSVQKRQENKNLKHLNRARTSDLIVTLRDRFIFAMLCGDPLLGVQNMDNIIRIMARTVSPVRVGRSFPRIPRHYNASSINLKSTL